MSILPPPAVDMDEPLDCREFIGALAHLITTSANVCSLFAYLLAPRLVSHLSLSLMIDSRGA
jgi:hypothetical protein